MDMTVVKDESGKHLYRVVNCQDITDRVKAEEALKKSEERLRLSTELANVAVWEYSFLENSMSRSTNHDRLYGLEWQTHWDIQTFLNATHPEDREYSNAAIQNSVAPGGAPNYTFDFRVVYPDQSIHWLNVIGQVVERDTNGQGVLVRGCLFDITKRKHAEEALQRNEQVLRLFVEYTPASIAMFDREMKYIVHSRRYLHDYELDEQFLTGRSHYDVFPEIPERWKEIHRRCLAGAVEKADQDPFPRADGSLDYVHWEIRPWYESNGEIGGIILFSEVITDQVQTEAKLKTRIAELNFLNKLSQLVSTQLAIDNVAQSAVEELAKYFSSDLVMFYLREGEKLQLQKISSNKNNFDIENARLHHVGECLCGLAVEEKKIIFSKNIHHDVRCTLKVCKEAGFRSFIALPLLTENEVIGLLGIAFMEEYNFSDNETFLATLANAISIGTKNVLFYQEIKQHREGLSKLLESSKILTSSIDLQAVLQAASDGVIKLMGMDSAAIYLIEGENLHLLAATPKLSPDFPDEFRCAPLSDHPHIREAVSSGLSVILHDTEVADLTEAERAICQARNLRTILYLPLISEGKIIGILIVSSIGNPRLISDLEIDLCHTLSNLVGLSIENARLYESAKRHAEELEQRVKERTLDLEHANIRLQDADRLKSVFLASMSHELRTPLNSIIGFTGILLMGLTGELQPEQKKQLLIVKQSANHLLSLINDVLDISKIEAGKVEIFCEKFVLNKLVADIIKSFKQAVEDKGISLFAEINKNITIFNDERRIRQVLINLINNAIKFTDKGAVKVIGKKLNNKNFQIQVRDTGCGIKAEDLRRIFEPFQQIYMSLTKKHEGTGLGLYLTKKIVALLGGGINMKSEYGKGSEFVVTLPLKHKEKKTNEKNISH